MSRHDRPYSEGKEQKECREARRKPSACPITGATWKNVALISISAGLPERKRGPGGRNFCGDDSK